MEATPHVRLFQQGGAESAERERLELLQRIHDSPTIAALERVGVAAGWDCLDVGAGAGSVARWLSRRVRPGGHVTATDLEIDLLRPLAQEGLEVAQHDIVRDTVDNDRYDLVHARLLLLQVPERREALRRMVQATRPGGWVVIGDIDLTTWATDDPSPSWTRVRRAFLEVLAGAEWDVEFGARLASLLEEEGLEAVEAESVARRVRGGSVETQAFTRNLERLRDRLLSVGVPGVDLDASLREVTDPSRTFDCATRWTAWGRRGALAAP